MDAIEYIRSRPSSQFLESRFTANKRVHRPDLTCVSQVRDPLPSGNEDKLRKKRQADSDVPHDVSLSALPPAPVSEKKSERAAKEAAKTARKERRKAKERAAKNAERSRPAPPQPQPQAEPIPDDPPHEEEKRVAVQPPSQSQPVQAPMAMQTQMMAGQGQFVGGYPASVSYQQQQPPPVSQYPSVQGKLAEIMRELAGLSQGLEAEQPNCRPLLESDTQFRYYWDALQSCSVSLQHVVSDIYYIHLSAQPVPSMQTQYMYQPMYYAPEQARPPPGYVQYYVEKPQNAEYS